MTISQQAPPPEGLAATDGSPPFRDRQKVDAIKWDKTVPKWARLGICIVIGQRKTRGCESGWMVNIMSKDGTNSELDSHWLSSENAQALAQPGRKETL